MTLERKILMPIDKRTSLDNITWSPITDQTLNAMQHNTTLREFLTTIDPTCVYHTSKRNVYLRRPDGRVAVHPKDGEQPYCLQCYERLGHKSPVAFHKVPELQEQGECYTPYCVNEDTPSQL